MRTLKLYLYGLLILLFALFVIQNYGTLTYSVSLRLNLGFLALESIPVPFFLIAPLIFFAGIFLATLIGFPERRRLARELKQTKAALREAEQKKNAPVSMSENKTKLSSPIEKSSQPS